MVFKLWLQQDKFFVHHARKIYMPYDNLVLELIPDVLTGLFSYVLGAGF